MSDLAEFRRTLLAIASPDQWLILADDYIKRFESFSDTDQFELPAKHAWLEPAIAYYANDLKGWVKFVKSVRDRLPPNSDEFAKVFSYYKSVNSRLLVQRQRRLEDMAYDVAIRKRILEDTPDNRKRYAKRCTQVWKKQRQLMLDSARADSPTGRVSVDHSADLLKEFWKNIEAMIDNGEVPKP